MNKKGQNEQIWTLIVFLLVGIPLISGLLYALHDISCQNEKVEINNLNQKLETCSNNILILNDSISKCDEKIDTIQNSCDEQIENATKKCQERLESKEGYKILIFQSISFIFVFFLTFSLFKIKFTLEIGDKINEIIGEDIKLYKRLWATIKLIIFILIILCLLGLFILAIVGLFS